MGAMMRNGLLAVSLMVDAGPNNLTGNVGANRWPVADTGFRDDDDAAHVGGKPYFERWDTGAVKGDWDFAANDAEWRVAA